MLAALAGVLLAAALPNINVAGFAWIAPALLLFAVSLAPSSAFKLGYVFGLAQWLTSLYWLLLIPFRWHGIPIAPATGWLALSGFLALYSGLWAWFCLKIADVPQLIGGKGAGTQSAQTSFRAQCFSVFPQTWLGRTIWAIGCGMGWVAIEMLQARVLTGFPWNFIAVSQYKFWPLIQIASVTGVYGVTFLVVWFSASLLSCAVVMVRKPAGSRLWVAEIIFPAAAIATIWFWGMGRAVESASIRGELKVALVQPSIEQQVIWDETKNPERFAKLMALSEKAVAEKADLLVWPEAAMPGFTEENFATITNFIATHHIWMIIGADDVERKTETGQEYNFYNASFLFDPTGHYVKTYRKLRLVIFGEYIPLARWLPFLKYFTPIQGGFAQGKGPVQFQLTEPKARVSPLICFEDVFPHFTGPYVEQDTDFLLNLTNDGWFGDSAAQWQHGLAALFRAVENGRPLVRCTNNGLTCWIDEFGRLRTLFRDATGNPHGEGFLFLNFPLSDKKLTTFYNQHGDWFGWSCVILAVGLVLSRTAQRRATARTSGAAT